MDTLNPVMEGLAHKPKPPKKVQDLRKHGIAEIHIKNNHDGTHHITHHHVDGRRESSTHSAQNLEELHDHLEHHLGGEPTKEEMEEHEEAERERMPDGTAHTDGIKVPKNSHAAGKSHAEYSEEKRLLARQRLGA